MSFLCPRFIDVKTFRMMKMSEERGNMLHGVLLIALFSCAAFYIGDFPWVKSLSFSPMIVGIVLGMLYANSLRNRLPATWVPGILFCSKRVLRLGIVLYGFRLTFQDVLAVGAPALLIDAVVVTVTICGGVLLGRLLKMDRGIALLTSVGSGICGAAAVLEDLGLPMDLKPEAVGEIGDEVGITFAFARTFHPAMRFVGPIRAVLGIPCVFNILGPLTNPANPAHVAIGCANRKVSPIMAAVYASRGQSGLVYTSHEGLDELAPTGPISVWEIRDGKVTETDFDPTVDLGLAKISVEQLKGGEPDVNAAAFTDFLAGKDIPSRTTALLNAASAIVADGNLVGDGTLAERFREAYALAENTVDSGKAAALFGKWIETAKSKA